MLLLMIRTDFNDPTECKICSRIT